LSRHNYDILIPGNYFCDLIFTGIPRFPSLGTEVYTTGLTVTVGGVLNTVIGLRRLGVNVGWCGRIGNDMFSQFVLSQIQKEGVDLELLQQIDGQFQRVTVAISYPEDRAFLSYADAAPNSIDLVLENMDKIDFRHLHFTGLQVDPRTPDLLRQVRARGVTISMDCQHRPTTLATPPVAEVLSLVDIFMPNLFEAQLLSEASTLEDAAMQLRQHVPLLVIKDGGNGVHAWRGDEYIYAPAISVTPLDTTGAGDVFNAGFLSGYLEGRELVECLRLGNICGGLSTMGHGGTSTAPHRAEVDQWLA
jgi:sugar/nucleoside kinase (ribokinase family)